MNDFIPVNEPLLDGNEKKYLAECIDTGWISSEGPFVQRFEAEFAARVGRKHGISVTNGTAALDAAVEAIGVGPGDEVILPTFTIISCIQQIVRSGATPVLVDADPLTWNMDVTQIEAKVTPHTKAIMVVHIYGLPVDMDPVLDICQRHGLKMIEDAAEAIGQTYRGRPCGSFGDISTVSFYPNKHVTTGEGGMLLTDDDELAETCRSLRNLCFQPGKRFVHERLGWNLRMTNLQAAVGIAQLERLDEFLERKRAIGRRYQELLADVDGLQLPLERTDYADNLYWVFGFVVDERYGNAAALMKRLGSEGIGTRPFFNPMHQQPVLRERGFFKGEHYPHAQRAYEQGLYVPSGLGLPFDQLDKTAFSIKAICLNGITA
ncbi:DegT/DnrJ/EryC1/StrS family aminotransferase [Cyanobium sp. FGCU-6]|nr:DegT/DnrJ/EryC1/StrS family aminotransferase [Cyanobium sp. FGCU6]